MKQILFLAACALAGTAAAQQQIHVLGDFTDMFKSGNVKSITYKAGEDGFTHMIVNDKAGAFTQIPLRDNTRIAVLHEGVADPSITPVDAASDEYKLLTDRQWRFLNAQGAGDGYTYPIDWMGDCPYDDKVTFTTDGKVVYDLGATNEVYCEFNPGPKTFTATGEESFVLGNKDSKLMLQFINGAFPTYRANVNGRGAVYSMTEPYEVVKLTETALQLKVNATDGEWVLINFERDPLVVLTPAEMLCAHAWKLGDGAGGTDLNALWGELGGSMDETIIFTADGKCTISSDGNVFCNEGDGGVYPYTTSGNEAWSLVDDNTAIQFAGGAFPLALGYADNVNCKAEIVSLKEDKLVLAMPYWDIKFYIVLVPAE